MKYEEIEGLLQYHELESKVFIPNEIFADFIHKFKELKPEVKNEEITETITTSKGIKRKKRGKNKGINISHIAFAYSYYYLICWLYRYAKYGSIDIDNGKIKEILGYTAITKGLDYIIKKNGLLDQMGYTLTTKDFPLSWTYEDDFLEFDLLSDMDEDTQKLMKQQHSRKFTIKFPNKGFHRTSESESDNYLDGTFYDISNTHMIPFEIFMYCMGNDKIGTIGFYLYCYIKMMNDKYSSGWDVSIENMVKDTNIPESTLIKYIDILRKFKVIEVGYNQEYFCLALDPKDRKANTYHANDFISFTYKPQFYKKMEVMKVEEYQKIKEEEFEKLFGSDVDISVEELPY